MSESRAGERPVPVGVLLAAGLLVVLMLWFGRACLPGFWVGSLPTSEDTYMLGALYESWAAQVKSGHLPLWFPEFGSGYPVHAAWMYGLFYPPLALFLALPVETAWTWLAIAHLVFGALGMYAFLWDRRRDTAAAASGAVVFALSDFMLQRVVAGHLNLVMPMAWAPWVLLNAARAVRGERGAAAWFGLCTGLGLLAGHAQVWFYVGPLVAVFALTEIVRLGAWRVAVPRLALGVAIALGISAVQWIPALELFTVTGHPQEKREVVEACSLPASALVAQIAPRFSGASPAFRAAELAAGRPDLRHEFSGLAGPLAVGAALLALRLRDKRRWFWFGALVFGLVLASGLRNGVGEFANDLPPFRWARAPGRGMTLVVLAGAVLSGELVADWMGGVAGKWRALAPPAFVASALIFGSPAPDAVRTDFYEYDWTRSLTPQMRGHRVYIQGSRYPYLERFGVRTMRRVCPVEPPGYAAMTAVGTSGPVAAWWLDIAAQFDLPRWPDGLPPKDVAATAALAAGQSIFAMTPGGAVQFFDAAERVPDDVALSRLRAGERALFIPPDAPAGAWRTTDGAALRRLRLAPRTDPDEIELTSHEPCSGAVFLSERWYPGWEATPPSVVARGNLAFLAVDVERPTAGNVVLRYRPWWRVPTLVAAAASVVLAAWIVLRRRGGAAP